MVFSIAQHAGPIGLDIGTHAIKAVQCDAAGRIRCAMLLPRLESTAELAQQEAERLARVLDRRGFQGNQVIVNVPPTMLLTSFLDLPDAGSGAPLQQIARMELARAHRIEPAELEARFWAMPDSPRHTGKGTHALVAGCRHQQANQLLDTLEAAGLEPRALDLPGWALVRACRALFEEAPGMIAAVDIGWRTVRFTLLQPQNLIYERVLGGSGLEAAVHAIHRAEQLDPQLVEDLIYEAGLTPRDDQPPAARRVAGLLRNHFHAIARELELSLSYAEHQYPHTPVTRIALIGGGAGIPGLAEQLSQWLELPSQPVGPEPSAQADDGPWARQPRRYALTPAAGLAQHPRELMA